MKDYGTTYSVERPEEVDVKSTKVFVATDIKEEKDGGYSYDLTEYDKDEYEAAQSGKKSAPAVRSGNDPQYFTTLNGYYCKDAAGRALLAELEDIVHPDLVTLNATQNGVYVPTESYGYGTVNVNVPFYARTDATLADVSTVEGDEMHIEPTAGTSYYPRLFLMSTPYPNPEQEDPTDRGKYFAPTDANYTVTVYIDIINKETGESVEGYPQKIVTTSSANFGINSGGYIRLKGWKVTTSENHLKVAVTTTRWNTTYSDPIDDTYNTQSNVETWLSAYTTGPYVIYDDLAKGTCGDNATWVLYKSGQLVISGTGTVTKGNWTVSKVKSVLISEGITAFANKLFYDPLHTNLRSAILPSTLSNTGSETFKNVNLTSVIIPEGVTSIGWRSFRQCNYLTSVTLPSTITSINNGGFQQCARLASMTVLATEPPTLGGADALPSTTVLQTIYVPAASVDAYKTAWSSYASVIQAIQE